MIENVIGSSWVPIIGDEFKKEYMIKLANWLGLTRESRTIYPEKEDVFKAFRMTPYGQIKVVIIGQDPYHDGIADGLAFSYKDGIRPPGRKRSLDIILDEAEQDCYGGFNVNRDYQLDYLAKQGVLLLNTVLTVFKGKPTSHAKVPPNPGVGWETFTSKVLASQILEPSPKVFLLWGNYAQDLFKSVVKEHQITLFGWHKILACKHPAADLYNADQFGDIVADFPNTFSGCKHFSQANVFLQSNEMQPIDWFPIQEPFNNKSLDYDFLKINV